ncbi:MAG: MBL fold metallo-hydrolase [Deltaproteobacteria bacterium]|nr:MBL fold metallo-hydrolase [Deltaproteobacteria bacterium]
MSRLTVVVDNLASQGDLTPEHGLAIWVEHQGREYLLDTGAGAALLPNLAALHLDPARLTGVILSHGHFDHGGGLAALMEARDHAPLGLWCHRGVFDRHLLQSGEELLPIGLPAGDEAAHRALGLEFHWVEGRGSLAEGLTVLAPIPRLTDFEGPAPLLMTQRSDGEVLPDPFHDDLALVVEGQKLTAVVSGCAHAGMVNVILAAQDALGRPPDLFVGGTHLGPAPQDQVDATLAWLSGQPGIRVVAGHCTGERAGDLARVLEDGFRQLAGGLTLEL